jgi:hypothetical protein
MQVKEGEGADFHRGNDTNVSISGLPIFSGGMTVYTIVLMLAFVGFVLAAQTAHGEDVIRLQNGTMVPNTLGVGAPNSEGITLLPNGTYGAYVNGAVGSQIGPVLVRDYHNGTITANSDMSPGARDNESDSNSTGNMTDPSSNNTQNINVTEDA